VAQRHNRQARNVYSIRRLGKVVIERIEPLTLNVILGCPISARRVRKREWLVFSTSDCLIIDDMFMKETSWATLPTLRQAAKDKSGCALRGVRSRLLRHSKQISGACVGPNTSLACGHEISPDTFAARLFDTVRRAS
jgi:hypothetical protein